MNTFTFTNMVKFDYSFPNVDSTTRKIIYDIIYDKNNIQHFGGGFGDGSNNSGSMYVSHETALFLQDKLKQFGIVKLLNNYQQWIDHMDHPNQLPEWEQLWDILKLNLKQDKFEWVETTKNMFEQMLEALPPAYIENSKFAMGEPFSTDKNGNVVFICFKQVNNQFFAQLNTIDFIKNN